MTRKLSLLLQCLAVGGQIIVPTLPIGPEWIKVAHAVIAAIQAILGVLAHSSNPDGTDSRLPYEPSRKPKLGG